MSFKLREYQAEIITTARGLMLMGEKTMIVQSPTGSGKTAMTAHMIKTAVAKGFRCWFIVHRRELIKQSVNTFNQVGLEHGIISAKFKEDHEKAVQICSIQTLARRFHKLKGPQLIVWDECHHVAARSWSKIFSEYPKAFHIGLTATPERLDGTGLGKWFKQMIPGPSVEWLIDNDFLSPYRLFVPTTLDMSKINMRMGDYVKSEMTAAVDKPTITGDAIREYNKHCKGKRAVIFCTSIEHSNHVVRQFTQAGIRAAHIDGETDTETRDETIEKFRAGEIDVISNVDLFGEGFDLPEMECVIILRPTASLGLHLQMLGRCLRWIENKTAVILDHVGNTARHGLPDQVRVWTLEGRGKTKKGSKDNAPVKICPRCFAANSVSKKDCMACGVELPVKVREIEHEEGELEEVNPQEMIRRRQQFKNDRSHCETLEQLVQLGIKRGMKNPRGWAKHVFNARQRKRLALGRR